MRVILAVVAVLVLDATAHAGPFRRSASTTRATTCTSGDCGTTTTTERSRVVVRGTGTAQGVAEIQAAEGRMGHRGGNRGYEGVGVGPTPEAALRACCANGGEVIDQGVARGADGRWYACRRYR